VAPWEARGLCIWLPWRPGDSASPLPHQSQVLSPDALEDFLVIGAASDRTTTFFNSLHGGSSANHLHLQGVYCDRRLAVESAPKEAWGRWSFLGNYPATGVAFPVDAEPANVWHAIERVQSAGFPFNLIFLASGVFLFVRNPKNEVLEEFPGRAFGAINLAGVFITSDPEERKRVTEETIASAYRKLTVSNEELLEILGG
jgi:hypothetical protein